MQKIYYNIEGWVCERYPYDIPIEDDTRFIEVEESVYQQTLGCESHKSWRVLNGNLFIDKYEEIPLKEKLIPEKEEIQNWLFQNDYIINKVFLREWPDTDSRFLEYKKQRDVNRKRLDEIEVLLKDLD
jgi:hypothetical protein